MSNTIDEKVVEMRFDNKDFETNIKDTMKTLDEFKKQLKFEGASDGFDNISKNAGKINFNGLADAIDTVKVRFSALEVIGITALTNITNSAINAGKGIVESLTIAPIKSGYEEYELTLNTIKTVMNATGKSSKEVERELKRLDDYADKTIYSTADMFTNISKFTNVGVPLEDASTAMIGIANATALAGRGAREASIAMYNLGQAIGVGYLNRIDYKSLQNAGIDTNEWKEAMINAALAAGTLTKAQDGMYKSGNKLYTMQNLFIDGLQTQWATRDVMMKVLTDYGSTEEDIGKKAWKAAQEVRTFSGMMEALKASVGTGWKETWQLLFGDLDEATKFWTRINDFVSGIIKGFTDKRNDFLKGVLDPISPLLEKIGESSKAVKETVDAVKDYVNVVDEIISGKWGNGQSRWDKLTEAGYDWAYAQNLVNERLGSSIRHSTDFSESQESIITSEEKVIDTTGKYIQSLSEMDDATLLSTLGDEKKAQAVRDIQKHADKLGLSVEELVDKSNELSGRTLIIESIANIGNSLVKIFEAVGKAWSSVFSPISADTVYDIVAGLYKFSKVIKNYVESNAENLTRTLRGLFSILSVIGNIVKGVLRVGFTVLGGILKIFGKTSSGVLDITGNLGDILYTISEILNKYISIAFDKIISLMTVGSSKIKEFIFNNNFLINSFNYLKDKFNNIINVIKEYISNNDNLKKSISTLKEKIIEIKNGITNWFEENEVLNTILNTLTTTIDNVTNSVKNFIQNNETIQNIFTNIQEGIDKAKTSLENWFNTLNKDNNIGKNIIDGIANGLSYGISKVIDIIKRIATKIKETFCSLFGIASPSKVFFEYGQNIIDGLINGLNKAFPGLVEKFKNIFDKIISINFDTINNVLLGFSTIIPKLSFLNIPRGFLNLFKACGVQSLAGLKEGLENKSGVFGTIIDLAQKIITKFKEILGINSPSKVFMEFGKNIIDGLINGIKNGFTKISDIFNELGNKIVEGFKQINFGNIAAIILATSMFVLVGKLIKVISSLSIDIAKGFADSLKAQKIQAEANKIKSTGEAVRNIGITIALIAASIFLISKIKEPWKAFAVIGAISGCIVVMYGLITLISYFDKANQASKGMNTVLKIAGSILLIAIAVNLISKYKIGQESIDVIAGLLIILGLFMELIRMTMVAGPNSDKAGDMILKISASILLMIVAIKLINKMNRDEIIKGIAVIGVLGVLIFAFLKFLKVSENDFKSISIMVLAMSASIILLIMAIKMINKMSVGEIAKGISVIGILGVLIFAFLKFLKVSENDFKSISIMVLAMSASIILLIMAIKMINSMTVGELIKGGAVIIALGALISLFVNTLKVSGSDFKSIGIMVLTISGAILLLVGALMLLTKIDAKELYTRIPIILSIGVLFGKLIATANSAKNAMATIITLTVALSMLIGAVALLTLLDQDKLKNATICVVALMGVLSVLIGVSKFAGGLKQTLSVIPMLILILGMSIGAIYLMSLIDTDKALSNVIALSVLLGTLTVVLLALKLVKSPSVAGLVSLGALTAIVLALTGILYLLQNIDATKVMPNVIALSAMLLSMTAVLGVLTIIGLGGPAAIIGVGSLLGLITVLTSVLVGLGALVSKFPQVEEFINKGETIFIKLGEILGSFVGNIINGITGALMDILPTIGTKLSEFMINITPFIIGIKMVDGNTVKSAGFLALAIAAISAAEVISGIASFLSSGQSLSELGTELTKFMLNAMPFFIMVQSIKPETLQGVESLASAILELTKAELIQGITKFIGGGTADISQFGSQLGDLAGGLNDFAEKVKNIDESSIEKVKAACEAIKAIADANNSIPNTGGWLSNIIGDNKIDEFGDAMPKLGAGLNGFVSSLQSFNESKIPIINSACEAIKKIADTNNSIPNTGGWLANIIGDNDIGTFGEKIATLGEGLNSFVTKLSNFTTKSQPIVDAACAAIKKIADLGNSIGDSGWYSKLIGQSDLEKFSNNMPELGKGVNNFVKELQDFSSEKVNVVLSACDAISIIASLGYIDLATLSSNLNDFGLKLTNFGSDIYAFVSLLGEVGLDTIQASIEKVKNLIDMASTIASINITSISTFSTSLVQVAKDGVTGFCEAFSGAEPTEQAKQAIITLLDAVIQAADSKKQDIYNKFIELMDKALEAMRFKKQDFINTTIELCNAVITEMYNYLEPMYNAGADFVNGFVQGMNDNAFKAKIAAEAMAKAALEAARRALDENSPSKETMGIGKYFGEGLAIGIKSYTKKVYNEAYNVGDTAKDGLSKAISKISSIIDNGIDTSPTIRPVLDLSNLESGVSTIDSMLNNGTVALNGNVDSISNNFKLRSQNGFNNSVEEAINNLTNKLQGLSGNTLNIYTQELDSNKLDQIVVYVDRKLGIKYLVK